MTGYISTHGRDETGGIRIAGHRYNVTMFLSNSIFFTFLMIYLCDIVLTQRF